MALLFISIILIYIVVYAFIIGRDYNKRGKYKNIKKFVSKYERTINNHFK